MIRPDPPAHDEPDGATRLRRHGTLLAEPIADCRPKEGDKKCDPDVYAFYGDPTTRHIDSVWVYLSDLNATGEPFEARLRPLRDFPLGARLLGVRLADDESTIHALLESEALGTQPAGLRGVVRVSSSAVYNGMWSSGLVPSPGLSPDEDLVRLAAMQVANPPNNVLFGGAQRSDSPTPSPPASATLEEAIDPEGLSIDEIWQGTFRRETERVSQAELRQWPRRERLRRGLWQSDYHTCARFIRLYNRGERCSLEGFPYSVSFAGTQERTTIRALSKGRDLLASKRPERRRGPGVVVPGTEPGEALTAYLARQPVSGRLVASAPLGSWGGTVGFVVPGPGAAHGPLLTIVDGSIGVIVEPWTFLRLGELDMASASKVEVRFLDLAGNGHTSLLVWVERPDRPPWASVFTPVHPLEPVQGPTSLLDGLGPWINRATSVDEAVAAALRVTDADISAKEFETLMAAVRTQEGFERHALADAIVFTFRGQDPFDQRSDFRPRDGVTSEDLAWIPETFESGLSMPAYMGTGGYGHFIYPDGQSVTEGHHVWITREAGRPRIVALARRVP